MNGQASGSQNRPRIAFLSSHKGSNLQVLLDACRDGELPATPTLVISNNADSGALDKARQAGIPALHLSGRTHPLASEEDAAILSTLRKYQVDLVVLAGYMKRIGPAVLAAYRNHIFNIHPGPLPAYGGPGMYGMRVHEAVLAAAEQNTAVTIHLVEEEYDQGPVLAVQQIPIQKNDTPQILAARVLQVEHRLYIETLRRILDGEIPLPGTGNRTHAPR